MCEPVTLGIMAGAGTLLSAKAASDAQDQAYEANRASAIQAKVDADRQINLQEAQNQEAAATQQLANDLATKETLGRVTAAAGETGAVLNNNALAQNIQRQGLEANTMVAQNLGRENMQLNEQRLGAKTNMNSRINQVSRGQGINLGTVLQAGTAGANAYMGAKSLKIGT